MSFSRSAFVEIAATHHRQSAEPRTFPETTPPAACPRWSPRFLRILLLLAGLAGFAQISEAGSILREVYQAIPGTSVSDLTNSPAYPASPNVTVFVNDFFEAPTDIDDNYGQRMHGYVVPPMTGNYTFWIASDDASELWLSTDENPANQRLIANVLAWTASREWTKEANQKSAAVALEAGKAYYIKALQKEGGGGDNLAVRWLRPDGVDEGPIPATYLLPFGTAFAPPSIAEQPQNSSAIEGQTATFTVKPVNTDLVSYQWHRNGIDLPGATSLTLNYGPVMLQDNGAKFSVTLSNRLGSTNSSEAVLTVLPDSVAPTLVAALNLGTNQIRLDFSEPVSSATATSTANYQLNNGASVTSAVLANSGQTVLLSTTPMTYGITYTLKVNNVTDLAEAQNVIAPGSSLVFTAIEYAPADVGTPLLAGNSVTIPEGVNVTGGGTDIGGTSDQFQFAWKERQGDFDVRVRVAGVTISDPYVHAGLMARQTLDANSLFAGVFASSPQLGCFFKDRPGAGAAVETLSSRGFPVNYPLTWLRLRRSASILTGFASVDGENWTQLGSHDFGTLPPKLFFGLAVTSDTTNQTATAEFRDIGDTLVKTVRAYKPVEEPLGPSTRATGIIISEIMYHPPERADGRNLEFVELYNARAVFEDLTDWRISGDIGFRFPAGFKLQAGDFVVLAKSPDDIKSVYGIQNVLGPYTGSLSRKGGTLHLRNKSDAIRLEIEFRDDPPWPVAADGAGHSLVLARPSFGENDPQAWAASQSTGGSPGRLDTVVSSDVDSVMFNELLAHTDDPILDFVELYNHSNSDVNLAGCWITDDPTTNKFRIPAGTKIPARGFLAFDQNQLGFGLQAGGETLFLINSNSTRVVDAIRFGGQENGVAFGRAPDGNPSWQRLQVPTPGGANAARRSESIVINEIMYDPISRDNNDEYLELYNRSGVAVSLAGWQFTDGIDFTFPANASLPAGGYLVVARNAARLLSNYSQLNAGNTFGDYSGSLANGGEHIELSKPDSIIRTNEVGQLETNTIHIAVAEVTYGTSGRWGKWSSAGGSSLELIDPNADPLRASNWADSDESGKAAWEDVSLRGRLDNGKGTPNRLHISMLGAGECLADAVQVLKVGSTNLLTNGNFEAGQTGWSFFGNHSVSTIDSAGAVEGTKYLHVRSGGDGDTGINSIRVNLALGLGSGNDAIIAAKVRWIAGFPEVLFRLQGNWMEFPVRLKVPKNLGTPGLPNSRRINNAGPAIFDVTHSPALPQANEPVLVTCRVSDPDNIGSVVLKYRVDPATTLRSVAMHDDGTGGDEVAGDGVYSGLIPGQALRVLVAFRIEAADSAAAPASTSFPVDVPAKECLVRWDDPIPFGTFAHYHLWNTAATETARSQTVPLNNTWRDATLVYGNFRVIYNVGFRDKGSPYHGGSGDFAVTVPEDDLLLGTTDRIFASTGNGGSEPTQIRSELASWLGGQLGIPYLHSHYIRLYRNGNQFREVMLDLEQPNHDYAKRWFPDFPTGDLYKVAVWFEFQDNNSGFDATSATIERFSSSGQLKLARYRWNFQRRANDGLGSNYTNLFDLVSAVNDTSTSYVNRVLNLADIDQWMRVYMFDFMMGNWDAWSYNVGQNMYVYKLPGGRWVLMPWDIDFVFGLGDGASGTLSGGQDPVINRMYTNPTFRRMMWQAYLDAVTGPYLSANYQPQIDARRSVLLKNKISGLQSPSSISTYIEGRRKYLIGQLALNDAKEFAITTSAGADFESSTPTATLEGTAPFAIHAIEVNGIPYPVSWTSVNKFRLTLPLTQVTNSFSLVGKNRQGQIIDGMARNITITYRGPVELPDDFVVINEVQYNPAEPNASFIEIYNRSATTPFDLSNYHLSGASYVFPAGAIIQPDSYLLLVKDRAAFGAAYGATIPVFGVFTGALDNDGEHLALVRPGPTPELDVVLSDLRYESQPPWPTNAAGFGSSLQLIDPTQDTYRVANWTAAGTNEFDRVTPGRANSVRAALEPFPLVWLNEVLPQNPGIVRDNAGDPDPCLELYNSGATTIDLSSLYLTDDLANLTQWKFPAGSVIPPKGFLLVWADGEPAETTAAALHTTFRLSATNGVVALVRLQGSTSAPAVIDYLRYTEISAGRSFGSFPDGEPRKRRPFSFPTLGGSNNAGWPKLQVTINEFMASNTRSLLDPANGRFEDWFELYNAASTAADLSGYSLTDDLNTPAKFRIPPGAIIPAGGFLLVWADDLAVANQLGADLHVNFKLSSSGEAIGLFDPDGIRVDSFAFGAQTDDVSAGRYPDGAELPLLVLDKPTPRQPNFLAGGNRPPIVAAIPNQTVDEETQLRFTVSATDPDPGQSVVYALGPDALPGAAIDGQTGAFSWTPNEQQGPGVFTFSIRATDNGIPPRTSSATVTVAVNERNQPPSFLAIPDQTIDEGSLFTMTLPAIDPDLPQNRLTFALEAGGPEGLTVDPSGALAWTPTEAQGPGTYTVRVRVTDDGTPPLSATTSLSITVREVNNPPVIEEIPPQVINELRPFTLQVIAHDSDGAAADLRYSFDLAPALARIDGTTGVISWTPSESDGPTNAIFIVRATEAAPPNLTSSLTFSVQVNESNLAPQLKAIPDQTILEGKTLLVRAEAQDSDLPPQKLTFSLGLGTPAGMTIDPETGLLTWPVDFDYGAATNLISVRVTDDGPGALSRTETFRVVVIRRPHVVINEIMYHPKAANAEFVELFNNSKRNAIDLSGAKLAGSAFSYVFPNGTILNPGQLLLVVKSRAVFDSVYGSGKPVAGEFTGVMNPTSDTLVLLNSDGAVLNEVRYGSQPPWATLANGQGASLQLIDATQDNRRVANWTGAVTNQPRRLVEMTNSWRFNQKGIDLGTAWREPAYDDAAWPVGAALLYHETAALPAPKNTPLDLGPTTYYFRTHFNWDGPIAGASLKLTTVLDDSMVLYLNGKEVYRLGIDPATTVTFSTFANRTVGDAVMEGPFDLPIDALKTGDNVLAAEAHQINSTSSDIVFGAMLEAQQTAAAFTPGAPNSVAAALPEFPPVWINEVLANNLSSITDASGERAPWIELHNAGPLPISLNGWTLTDSYAALNRWSFPPDAEIEPGEFLVLWIDGEANQTQGRSYHTSFRLAATGGAIALARPQRGGLELLDYVDYPALAADRPFGSMPDDDPLRRTILSAATPGGPNQTVTAPFIQDLQLAPDGTLSFQWSTVVGLKYRLEFTENLGTGIWQSLGETVSQSAMMKFEEPIGLTRQGFYRVVLAP